MNYEEYCKQGSPSAQNIYLDKLKFRELEVLEEILAILKKNDVTAKKLETPIKPPQRPAKRYKQRKR